MHVIDVKKSRKRSSSIINSYSKDSTFTAVGQRDEKFLTMYVKGVPFRSCQ